MSDFKCLGTRFRLTRHYELIGPLGKGSYGVVVAAKDVKTG
jgi:hypothetical protein